MALPVTSGNRLCLWHAYTSKGTWTTRALGYNKSARTPPTVCGRWRATSASATPSFAGGLLERQVPPGRPHQGLSGAPAGLSWRATWLHTLHGTVQTLTKQKKRKVTLYMTEENIAKLRLHSDYTRLSLSKTFEKAADMFLGYVTDTEMRGYEDEDDETGFLKPAGEFWKPGDEPPKVRKGRPPGT